jgi:hypothetical protein
MERLFRLPKLEPEETDHLTPDGKTKHPKIDRKKQSLRSWLWGQKHANDIVSKDTPVEEFPPEIPEPFWQK